MGFVDDNRMQLEHWLRQKRQADKQIELLTTDPVTHVKYAALFRKSFEQKIKDKEPAMSSYKKYKVYQNIRKKLHTFFGYDTTMMTKKEYETALSLLDETLQ